MNDPYETTNLYDSTLSEHVQVKQALYDLLPDITAKAKTKISIKWSDVALDTWGSHGNLVVPWQSDEDVSTDSKTTPKYCTRST